VIFVWQNNPSASFKMLFDSFKMPVKPSNNSLIHLNNQTNGSIRKINAFFFLNEVFFDQI